jgi:hypothetical protein
VLLPTAADQRIPISSSTSIRLYCPSAHPSICPSAHPSPSLLSTLQVLWIPGWGFQSCRRPGLAPICYPRLSTTISDPRCVFYAHFHGSQRSATVLTSSHIFSRKFGPDPCISSNLTIPLDHVIRLLRFLYGLSLHSNHPKACTQSFPAPVSQILHKT